MVLIVFTSACGVCCGPEANVRQFVLECASCIARGFAARVGVEVVVVQIVFMSVCVWSVCMLIWFSCR